MKSLAACLVLTVLLTACATTGGGGSSGGGSSGGGSSGGSGGSGGGGSTGRGSPGGDSSGGPGGVGLPSSLPGPKSLPPASPSGSDSGSAPPGGGSGGDADDGESKAGRETGSAETESPAPGTGKKDGSRGGSAQTPQERRAEVDGKLDASLGGFDEQLKREQQRTAQERDARAAGGSGSSSGASSTEDDGTGTGPRRGGRDRAGDLRSDRREGEATTGGDAANGSQTGSSAPLPGRGSGATNGRVIPDGSDDDIIARRLRKAAESETDPELKDKLWKEYVDYKANARGGR